MKLGDQLPPFNLMGVDGNVHSPDNYSEYDAFAVVFFCNHCPYVLKYVDRILSIYAKNNDKGFNMVAINSNDPVKYSQDSFENMQKMAEEKDYKFPYVFDETQEVAKVFCAERTPEVFLFDNSRKLVYQGGIDDNCDNPHEVKEKYFENAIEAILTGAEIKVKESQAVGCSIKWK